MPNNKIEMNKLKTEKLVPFEDRDFLNELDWIKLENRINSRMNFNAQNLITRNQSINWINRISNKPWVDVRNHSSFSAAVDAIGASEKTLLIPDEQAVTDDKTVPSNVTLMFLQSGSLNISAGVTVTINGYVEAGLYQIFKGDGVVSFTWDSIANIAVYPQWWGAKGDNSTACSAPISKMVASLPSSNVIPMVKFLPGVYKISGNPAINFNKSLHVVFNGATLDYGTGTGIAVQVGGAVGSMIAPFYMDNLEIIRDYDDTGVAGDELVGEGLRLQNTKNFRITNPTITGFGKGLYFYGNQQGTSYGSVHNPILVDNLIGVCADSTLSAASFCTNIGIYEGRSSISSGFSSYVGTKAFAILDTNLANRQVNGFRIIGLCLEGQDWERKVYDTGAGNLYEGCYWELSNGGTDIEFTSDSGYCMLIGGHHLHAQVITDAGTANMYLCPKEGLHYGTAYPSNYGIITKNWCKRLLNDDAQHILAVTDGFVFVVAGNEGGMWILNGTSVTKICGTANTADTNSDGNLCVCYVDPNVVIFNRLGSAQEIRATWHYQ